MTDQFEPLGWSINTNIYEINLRQYTLEGSFTAFGNELPRLKDMGIDILWFMPIQPISVEKRLGTLGSYYACSDYTAINPEFGNLDDFKALVEKAHGLGLKVIIDWVANHTGWDHRWRNEHPEYYRKNDADELYDANGWMDVIDLNYDKPELRTAMLEAMRFWVDNCNIDGFRCDMAMLVPLSFWKMVRQELDQVKKLFWLAECEDIDYHQVFDASYGWKMLHTMEAFWRGETGLNGLEDVCNFYHVDFPKSAQHLLFTSNHDENSHSGSEYERLGFASRAFAVFTCTWNGIPLIYSGQELPNKKRLKFFDKDQIEWDGKYRLHHFYKTLLELRKTNPVFLAIEEAARILPASHSSVLAFSRSNRNDGILVILNLSYDDVTGIALYDSPAEGNYRNVFSSHEIYLTRDTKFSLKPWDYLLYEKI